MVLQAAAGTQPHTPCRTVAAIQCDCDGPHTALVSDRSRQAQVCALRRRNRDENPKKPGPLSWA